MPGVVFYEGPSCLDGAPVIGVATWDSQNPKTGNLLQTWILRADLHPVQAINTGADKSICGGCPLRGEVVVNSDRSTNHDRPCYVQVGNAPSQIYRTWALGRYPRIEWLEEWQLEEIASPVEGVRFGSYGDPVAIPKKKWRFTHSFPKKKPGYTHQWKKKKFHHWATQLMASTHSLEENKQAHALGFRTFRTLNHISEKAPNEIICPASKEGGFRETCATCGACDGRRGLGDRRANVAIVAHGGPAREGNLRRLIELPMLDKNRRDHP